VIFLEIQPNFVGLYYPMAEKEKVKVKVKVKVIGMGGRFMRALLEDMG